MKEKLKTRLLLSISLCSAVLYYIFFSFPRESGLIPVYSGTLGLIVGAIGSLVIRQLIKRGKDMKNVTSMVLISTGFVAIMPILDFLLLVTKKSDSLTFELSIYAFSVMTIIYTLSLHFFKKSDPDQII